MIMFLQIVIMLVLPFVYVAVGKAVFDFLGTCFKTKNLEVPKQHILLIFGLLAHLVLIFALKLCSAPWWLAFFLPLSSCFFVRRTSFSRPQLSFNFVIWFFVVLATGVSLFQYIHGNIETGWINNYGELPFHLGVISSFANGDNFPPQHHLYSGVSLSYPFFINLWSASLWWMNGSYDSLHLIFIYQWVLLWCILFFLCDGNKYRIIPWALFLGGGSFSVVNEFSWKMISGGYPWTVLMTTVWVTQRSALFGLVASLSVVSLVWQSWQKFEQPSNPRHGYAILAFAGLLLGMSPLAHVHYIMVASLFIGLVWLGLIAKKFIIEFKGNVVEEIKDNGYLIMRLPIIGGVLLTLITVILLINYNLTHSLTLSEVFSFNSLAKYQSGSNEAVIFAVKKVFCILTVLVLLLLLFFFFTEGKRCCREWWQAVCRSVKSDQSIRNYFWGGVIFCLCASIGFGFLPVISDKSSIIRPIMGWYVPIKIEGDLYTWAEITKQVKASFTMWFTNWNYVFLVFAAFCLLSCRLLYFSVFVILFIFGNCVCFAVWDWDQLKYFLALYSVFLLFWSFQQDKTLYRLHYILIILCIPSLIELYRCFDEGRVSSPYTKDLIAVAETIKKETPPDAVFVAAPDHNTPVVLAGRKMYIGYTGTLWTHDIDYKARFKMFRNLNDVCNCSKYVSDGAGEKNCPTYLLWDRSARKYWNREKPCDGARWISNEIYRINE